MKSSEINRLNVFFWRGDLIAFITFSSQWSSNRKEWRIHRFVIWKHIFGEIWRVIYLFIYFYQITLSTFILIRFSHALCSSPRQFSSLICIIPTLKVFVSCCFSRFITREKQKIQKLEIGQGKGCFEGPVLLCFSGSVLPGLLSLVWSVWTLPRGSSLMLSPEL